MTTTETKETRMSVTRALTELKRLDKRIVDLSTNGVFLAYGTGHGDKFKLRTPNLAATNADGVKSEIQSNFDTLFSLIERRAKIKAKIVLSNANTKVTIANREMAVAEAIELKSYIAQKNSFIGSLQSTYIQTTRQVTALNEKLNETIETSLNTMFGSADKAKLDANTIENISRPKLNAGEAVMLDPIGIVSVIKKCTDELSEFTSEVDYVLNESNSSTVITID